MNEIQYKLGMGQMLVEGGSPARNLDRASNMIRRAAEEGCAIIVLPECLNLGWTHPSARELADTIPGRDSDILAKAAAKFQIYVVAGLVERDGQKLYNSAVLISPEGIIRLKHRKINELDIAHDLYSLGDSLSVVQTPLGTIGVDICADNLPDSLEIGNTLAAMGAEIILSPSAWAVEADHDQQKEPYGELWKESYTKLATRHNLTVVGVSDVGWIGGGPWQGHKSIGCSLAVGPGGAIITQGPYGEKAESLIVITISINSAHNPAEFISGQTITHHFQKGA